MRPADALAQVLEHEILVCRGLALVLLLRPLLERQLDPERLVDRKRDVGELLSIDGLVVAENVAPVRAHERRVTRVPWLVQRRDDRVRGERAQFTSGTPLVLEDNMAAGTGVQHSVFNPSKDEPVHLLQIWIQPDAKGVKPRYAEKSLKDAAPGTLNLVTSKTGRNGSIAIHQDADLWLAKLDPGHRVTHTLAPGRHAWVHVAEGAVSLNGKALQGGDAAAVTGDSVLELSATRPAQVLVFDLN